MVIELKYWNFEKLFPPISIFLFFNEKWTRWGKERSLQDWGIFFAFLFTSKLQFIAICALGPTASALHLSLQPFKLYFLVVFSAGRPLGYFMDYLIWNEVWLGPGDEAGARLDLRSHAHTQHSGSRGSPWLSLDVYETLKMSGEHLIKSFRWGRLQKVKTHGVAAAICSLCIYRDVNKSPKYRRW